MLCQRNNVQHVAFLAQCQQTCGLMAESLERASAGKFCNQIQITEVRRRHKAVTISNNGRIPGHIQARFQSARVRIQGSQGDDDLSEVVARTAIDDVEIVDLLPQSMSLRGNAAADEEFYVTLDENFQQLASQLFFFR